MGRPTTGNKTKIKEMKNHHRSMARDIIAMGEIRNVDLARIYNMTEAQISIIINSPCFIAYLAEMETQIENNITELREDIRLLVPRASQVIKEELFKDGAIDQPLSLMERKMRLSVAFDIWDRDSGRKKHGESAAKEVHYHQHNELHMTQNMTTEDLQKDIFDLIAEEE